MHIYIIIFQVRKNAYKKKQKLCFFIIESMVMSWPTHPHMSEVFYPPLNITASSCMNLVIYIFFHFFFTFIFILDIFVLLFLFFSRSQDVSQDKMIFFSLSELFLFSYLDIFNFLILVSLIKCSKDL